MKPRERRDCVEGGGDGVQGKDIVRQTTSRQRGKRGHGTMEEEDKARNERKNGQERRKRLVGWVWVFILRRGTQLFHGCRLGCRWKQRQDAPTLIGKGAHPFTIPRVRDSNHLTRYLFAFPRDHRDSFISPKERDSLLVLFLAMEHASCRVELKTVDCKWYGRVAESFAKWIILRG